MPALGTVMARARDGASEVLTRFPLPIALGALGTLAGCRYVLLSWHRTMGPAELTWLAGILSSWLGLPLALAGALAVERRRGTDVVAAPATRAAAAWPFHLAVLGLIALAFVGLDGQREPWRAIRFALWMVAAHGLLAILPVLPLERRGPRATTEDFRAFNVTLFARTVNGLLITHVSFAGLAFALRAIHQLFDVEIADPVYECLWFVMLGIVNTIYVLAGIPRQWDRAADNAKTPALLDVLARYVLLPLSALYLAILYVYSARIIWTREWPRGWVSAPVIVFSATGLLTVLLLGPEGDRGTRFVRAYCRTFFVALLPLVALLFMAIGRRAGEYGLTEERCLVYAIGVFLGIIGPYFVFSRRRRLASIPVVLGLIAIGSSVGPLSAASMSLRSQRARLRELLATNHLLGGWPSSPGAPSGVSARDEAQISAILWYLDERGQMRVLSTLGDPSTCSPCGAWRATTPTPAEVMASLNLKYRPWGEGSMEETSTSYYASQPAVFQTTGYDWAAADFACGKIRCGAGYGDTEEAGWEFLLEHEQLLVARNGRRVGAIPLGLLRVGVAAAIGPDQRRVVPPDLMTTEGEWPGGGRYRLSLSSLEAEAAPGGGQVTTQVVGRLLLRVSGRGTAPGDAPAR